MESLLVFKFLVGGWKFILDLISNDYGKQVKQRLPDKLKMFKLLLMLLLPVMTTKSLVLTKSFGLYSVFHKVG